MIRFQCKRFARLAGVLFLFVAVVMPYGMAGAQNPDSIKSIEAIGTGLILKDNMATARDVAVKHALCTAVEQTVGLILSSELVVENFQLLSDRIYTQSQGLVRDYKVLAESRSGKSYRVIIRATVSVGMIHDQLQAIGILTAQKGMPRIMLLLAEQNIGQPQPQFWWGGLVAGPAVTENIIAEEMKIRGFALVDRAALIWDIQSDPALKMADLTDQAAIKLGNRNDAEIVIVGKSVASYTKNIMGTGMKSYQADLSLRAIRTDTGEVIASSTCTGAVFHTDDVGGGLAALQRVGAQAADDLIPQITAKWQREESRLTLVKLTVEGIKEYSDLVAFRKVLSSRIRGVKNVYLCGIDAGEARMEVEIKGNAQTLADKLMLERFDNFAINIFNVSQNAIQLRMVPQEKEIRLQ